jgi:hypothetical protein
MPNDSNPIASMKESAEKTMSQAAAQTRGAVDTYFNTLKSAIESFPVGESEVGKKLKSNTKQNIDATHEYMNKLSQAQNFQEVLQMQTEFFQKQLHAFVEQAQSVGEAMTKAAAGSLKPPFGKG